MLNVMAVGTKLTKLLLTVSNFCTKNGYRVSQNDCSILHLPLIHLFILFNFSRESVQLLNEPLLSLLLNSRFMIFVNFTWWNCLAIMSPIILCKNTTKVHSRFTFSALRHFKFVSDQAL